MSKHVKITELQGHSACYEHIIELTIEGEFIWKKKSALRIEFVGIIKKMGRIPLRQIFFLFLAVLLLEFSQGRSYAQPAGREYFAKTGHYVEGEFLAFYHKVADPVLLYGYPITEQMISTDGKRVQYFQRARFEYEPSLPEGQRVRLTPIGKELYTPGTPIPYYNPAGCRLLANNIPVCFAFLEFFEKNGGIAQFGNPISSFEIQGNLIVQYFENARLEWRPWMPEGQRVAVSELGRLLFDKKKEPVQALAPLPPPDQAEPIPPLQVRASTLRSVTSATDRQMLFIIVQDRTLQPVRASGKVTVFWPNNTQSVYDFSTNENGLAILTLEFSNMPYGGVVYIHVQARYIGKTILDAQTQTSFRIWY